MRLGFVTVRSSPTSNGTHRSPANLVSLQPPTLATEPAVVAARGTRPSRPGRRRLRWTPPITPARGFSLNFPRVRDSGIRYLDERLIQVVSGEPLRGVRLLVLQVEVVLAGLER